MNFSALPKPPRSAFAGPPAPRGPEPSVDPWFEVLYETDSWAAVDKSGNLPCHPAGRYEKNTLDHLLRERAGFAGVHFVSRLDRETSGIVLVAKNAEAAGRLGKAMMAHHVHKEYLCFVRGAWTLPADADGETNVFGQILAAGDDVVHKYRRFVRETDFETWRRTETNTSAQTLFSVVPWDRLGVDERAGDGFTALRCRPLTGRTHQIRATLKGLGFEVVGDKLYGPDYAIYARLCEDAITAADWSALGMKRQALHAWRLEFRDPDTRETIRLEASPARMVEEFKTRS